MDTFENVDLQWQPEPLRAAWPGGHDMGFLLFRIEAAFRDKAIAGTPGKIVDVACGHGMHLPDFAGHGWHVFALDPSMEMLRRTRERLTGEGVDADMLRCIGEALPFQDGSFERVVCQSSLDHFANPVAGMREMARILDRDGSVVIGIVNYRSLSVRGSRLLYRILRALRIVPRNRRFFWDTPTFGEHTFEGSVPALRGFSDGSLRLVHTYGVSMLCAFPGWSRVLRYMPEGLRTRALRMMDRVARRVPTLSDFVVTTWRKA